MELKRIIARDSRSANEKALQLYGQDVLIISSHKVDNQIELVVAVETTTPAMATTTATATAMASPTEAAAPAFKSTPALVDEAMSPGPSNAPEQAFSQVFEEEMVNPLGASNMAAAKPNEHDMVLDALTALSRRVVTAPASVALADSVAPVKAPELVPATALSLAAAPHPDMVHDFRRSQETVELLRQEMSALRQEFALSRQMAVWQGGLGLSPEIEHLWRQLLDLGMPTRLRSLLLDSVRKLSSVQEARGMVYQLLTNALVRPALAAPQRGVHALCGPSGAGKTLMVMRLARQACAAVPAEQQAIISFCDQRPGAWSQLQVLAAQTGVECYKAGDAPTLKLLLDDLSGRTTVWIDTPGTDFLGHAATLRGLCHGLQLHAVLPVDASVTSVQKMLESPSSAWASLMLSKFDEAAYPWPLIQGLCNSNVAVSVVSQGAAVASETAGFEPFKLVEMALAPLGDLPVLVPKKKAVRPRAIALESPKKVVAKRSRTTVKAMNA